jgi:4-amino-4-deoxy-L-arabinose transferase-like glycosyltransferase
MDTRIDHTAKVDLPDQPQTAAGSAVGRASRVISTFDIALAGALALAALIPCVILATQLDLVTDEVVNIQAGKIYRPLLLWPAIRRPWLYLLVGMLVGLAGASKYPAALAVPGMLLFSAYYFLSSVFLSPASSGPPSPGPGG